MKRFGIAALASLAFASSLFAATLDEKTIKIDFEGYKTASMIGTKGGFTTAKFNFKDGDTLKDQLTGAVVTLSPKDIDMGGEVNQVITNNIVNVFFKTLNNKREIKVEILNVLEGESRGIISAKVMINRQSIVVPLVYEVLGNGDFSAQGRLDLFVFSNATKALQALSDAAPGHAGVSWNLVDINITGKLTN